MWVKVSFKNRKYAIGFFYRPPNGDINEFISDFEENISNIVPICDEIICVGDVNINLLDLDNINSIKFLSVLEAFDLNQIINEPTRITANKMSLIDVAICSQGLDIITSGVAHSTNIQSDHELIYCTVLIERNTSPFKFKTYRDFKNFNYNRFQEDLESIPLYEIFDIEDINLKLLHFNNLILNLFDLHAPVKTVRITKPKAPWLTDNIQLMIDLRDKALARFKKSRNPAHFNYYKELRNFTTNAIRNEKRHVLIIKL